MQLTIFITPEVADTLRRLAAIECRSTTQEARWLLLKAIEQSARDHNNLEEGQTAAVRYEPALAE